MEHVEDEKMPLARRITTQLKKLDMALIFIMALTASLYLYNLGELPFAPDEATYTAQSAILAGHNEFRENFIPYSRSATNFQIQQWVTSLFLEQYGISEYVARIPTVIMGVLSVLLIYLIANELFNRRMALLSSLFIGLNGYSLHFNRQINLDTPLVFFMILAILFIVKWRRTRHDWYFYFFLISTIFATMSKVIIVIPLAIVAFVYLYIEGDHKDGIKMLFKPVSVLIMTVSLLYATYFIIDLVGIGNYIKTLTYAADRESKITSTFYLKTVVLLLGYAFPIITGIGLVKALRERKEGDILCVVWFASILLFFTYYPLQGYNYIFPIVPPVCLLSGRAVDYLADKIHKSTFVGIMLPVMILLSIYPTFAVLNNPDQVVNSVAPVRFDSLKYTALEDASLWLKNNAKPGSKVAVYTFADSHVIGYYSGLKLYPVTNFPGYYMPSDDGVAKISWDTTDVIQMIQDGNIDYVVYMDEPRLMKNMTRLYSDDGIGFNPVYRKSYRMPVWYTPGIFNISIFQVDKGTPSKMANISDTQFTVIVLPDTQEYIRGGRNDIFLSQTKWIKENIDSLHIKFVLQTGDIVDTGKSDIQWRLANKSMGVLDGVVPYLIVSTDHMWVGAGPTRDNSMFNSYFNYTRFDQYKWYGGHYPSDGNQNAYGLFSSNGEDFLVMTLEFCPTDDDLQWADNIISENPNRTVILNTHAYLSPNGDRMTSASFDSCSYDRAVGNEGEDIWNKLISKHKNIVLVISSHRFGYAEKVDYVEDYPIYQIMENFQSVANGGNGFLTMYTFIPQEKKIEVRTYSPFLQQYDTAPEHQFDLTYKD